MPSHQGSGRPLGHAEVTLLGLEQARRDFGRTTSSPGAFRTALRRLHAVLTADDRPQRATSLSRRQATSRGR